MDIDERQIKIDMPGATFINWFLDLTTASTANLPFKNMSPKQVDCEFEKMKYVVTTSSGNFSKPNDSTVFRITPEKNAVIINLSERN